MNKTEAGIQAKSIKTESTSMSQKMLVGSIKIKVIGKISSGENILVDIDNDFFTISIIS